MVDRLQSLLENKFYDAKNILIDLDCLYDIRYGLLRYVLKKYPKIYEYESTNKDSFVNTYNALKHIIHINNEYNPLNLFTDRDTESIYNDLMKNDIVEVFNHSCPTNIVSLLLLSAKASIYRISIGYTNELLKPVLKDKLEEMKIQSVNLVYGKLYEDIDCEGYDNVFLFDATKAHLRKNIIPKIIYIPDNGINIDFSTNKLRDPIEDKFPLELINIYSPYTIDDSYLVRG